MIVLEYLLYIVCAFVGYFAYRVAWTFFPKKISRRDKYHKSEWELFQDRWVYALSMAIVFGGCGIGLVYIMFHPDIIDNENKTSVNKVAVSNIKHEKVEKVKTISIKKEMVEEADKDKAIEKQTPLDEYNKLIQLWDAAHNNKDFILLQQLYMEYVKLNGVELSKRECISLKEHELGKYSDYTQYTTQMHSEVIDENSVKCMCLKSLQYDGKEEKYHVCILLTRDENGDWKIEIEEVIGA